RLGERDVEMQGLGAARDAVRDDRPPCAIRELEAQGERARGGALQSHVHADTREVGIWREVHELQRIAPARLEVHGLPHAARFSVALLALELEGVRRIVHAYNEPLACAVARLFQLEGERGVAALVLAELLAVEPRRRPPVRRSENEKHPASAPGVGYGDVAGIRADVPAVRHAGERGAPRERHHDLTFAAVLSEPELPAAVEIEPLCSLEIGARVFGERNTVRNGVAQETEEERKTQVHSS